MSRPAEENNLILHWVISFPKEDASFGPYAGGHYWGVLEFPESYPLRPPAVKMMTPSGRFSPGDRLCFSFSDFHPETCACARPVEPPTPIIAPLQIAPPPS